MIQFAFELGSDGMYMIDWGFAVKLAGVGLSTVFIVLSLVALVLWLIGLVLRKAGSRQKEEGSQ